MVQRRERAPLTNQFDDICPHGRAAMQGPPPIGAPNLLSSVSLDVEGDASTYDGLRGGPYGS